MTWPTTALPDRAGGTVFTGAKTVPVEPPTVSPGHGLVGTVAVAVADVLCALS